MDLWAFVGYLVLNTLKTAIFGTWSVFMENYESMERLIFIAYAPTTEMLRVTSMAKEEIGDPNATLEGSEVYRRVLTLLVREYYNNVTTSGYIE